MDEVRRLGALQPPLLNRAKEILAYEATALAHGPEKARQAYLSAVGQFGSADPEGRVATSSAVAGIRVEAADIIPSTKIPRARFADGLDIVQALIETGLVPSKGEARRLVSQGGVTVNDRKVESTARRLGEADLADGAVVIKLGKKRFHRLVAE